MKDTGEWIEAEVVDCKFDDDWYYLLKDKAGNDVWRNDPTWIHEDDVQAEDAD